MDIEEAVGGQRSAKQGTKVKCSRQQQASFIDYVFIVWMQLRRCSSAA